MESTDSSKGIKAASFVFENKGKLKDFYRIGKLIGSGAFGDVRICLHKESNSQRAVKILYKANMTEEDERMLINEINILRDLDHPNIVKMYEFFQDEKRYYIITELCKGGELFDEIIERGHFTEKDAAVIIRQLLSCINYCHARNIVHRDIKPENILLETNKDFSQVKIIDFGISVVKEANVYIEESIGTPYYIAPEVWKKKYDEKCDEWSCGVILYILLSGTPPFNAPTDAEMKKKILDGSFLLSGKAWDDISEEAKDLVSQLLTYDKDQRISSGDALVHPWIIKMCETEYDTKVAKRAFTNLSKFRAEEKIKQATIAFIASQLLSK